MGKFFHAVFGHGGDGTSMGKVFKSLGLDKRLSLCLYWRSSEREVDGLAFVMYLCRSNERNMKVAFFLVRDEHVHL